jgi:hypothetical protein
MENARVSLTKLAKEGDILFRSLSGICEVSYLVDYALKKFSLLTD